jgi:Putative zinc-finger
MDCRSFKKKHLSFVDDTLSGVETDAMREHLRVCLGCARQDAAVRRALLVLRNLPPVDVSPDFSGRLKQRIAVEAGRQRSEHLFHGPSVAAFFGLAGAVVAVGVLGIGLADRETPNPPSLAAVVFAPREITPRVVDSDIAAPAFVASMSTGIPVWPALLLAEQGSLRFATTELTPTSYHSTPQR